MNGIGYFRGIPVCQDNSEVDLQFGRPEFVGSIQIASSLIFMALFRFL